MTGWLLDTNIISELRKPKPEPKILKFVASAPLSELYVSVVSLAEIRFCIELSTQAQKRAVLQDWLTFKARPMFDPQHTLAVTEDILLKWRLLMEDGRRTRHTFSQPDVLIAAIASHHGLTVVSRDWIHFDRAGIPVLNPWEAL